MREIGIIKQVQVQVESLKQGERPSRWYGLDSLRVVPMMKITAQGVVGLDGAAEWLDVHHMGHPRSRNRGGNHVSFNFTSHYGRMHNRYGDHMTLGCAGENIIVATADSFTLSQLAAGVVIVTGDGRRVHLDQIAIMLPCLPFSKYSLQDANPAPDILKETLQFLDEGMRGFMGMLRGETAVIRPGDKMMVNDEQ